MALSETAVDTIAKFSFAFTALVTVIGWFIVAAQSDRREFRKELRDRLSEVAETAASIQEAALAYWVESTAATSASAAIKLKAEVKRLGRQTATLAEAGLKFEQADLMASVRRSATGGDFDTRGRRHSRRDYDILANTVGSLEDLLLAADFAFYERFRANQRIGRMRALLTLPLLLLVRE